jgi:hypothetical protein
MLGQVPRALSYVDGVGRVLAGLGAQLPRPRPLTRGFFGDHARPAPGADPQHAKRVPS